MRHASVFIKVNNTQIAQVIFAIPRAVRLKVSSKSKLVVEVRAALEVHTCTSVHTANLSVLAQKRLPLRLETTRTTIVVPRHHYGLA